MGDPIRSQVLTQACGKVSGCLTDVTGITACARKFVYYTRTEPSRKKGISGLTYFRS